MNATTETLTSVQICSSESAALQRFYELVAEILRSIADSEQQQAEAA